VHVNKLLKIEPHDNQPQHAFCQRQPITAQYLQSYPEASVHRQKCNPPRTSQKICGGFRYGVYRPGEWLWTDSNGKTGN